MADKTGIEWTDASWNPVVGCSIVSPGCTNCYAMKMAGRIEAMGTAPHYAGTSQGSKAGAVWTGKLSLAPDHILTQPLRWKRGRRIFVNSMGDLFHEDVPDAWIDRVFAVMALTPQHTYQVLTKRSARMREYLSTRAGDWQIVWPDANPPGTLPISRHEQRLAMRGAGWPDAILRPTFPLPNVWLGVSAENQRHADNRIPDLLETPAAIRFVSAEPLLGPIDFRDALIPIGQGAKVAAYGAFGTHPVAASVRAPLDWIIVGGESGKGARPMHPDWARSIRDQCAAAGTAFFFKQWGEWQDGSGFKAGWKAVTRDGRIIEPTVEDLHDADRETSLCGQNATAMRKVGKACAGRLLDGVTHDAMPEVRHG